MTIKTTWIEIIWILLLIPVALPIMITGASIAIAVESFKAGYGLPEFFRTLIELDKEIRLKKDEK